MYVQDQIELKKSNEVKWKSSPSTLVYGQIVDFIVPNNELGVNEVKYSPLNTAVFF